MPVKDKIETIKPFVKWAGGKGQLLESIRAVYPKGLGTEIKKYAEPFVGGGAVLFDILSRYQLEEIYICDINAELINAYQTIRDDVEGVIDLLLKYQNEYIPLDTVERKAYYYDKRARFNELKMKRSFDVENAALFIFLNRTCYNGLYRVNRKGLFNVPMGSYKKPTICDAANLRNVSLALTNVTIVCGDYKNSREFIDENTFVYFDPPYRPLTTTSNFTSYAESEFDDKEQIELAEYVQELTMKGAFVLVSNSDPKNIKSDDEFFDLLYAKQKINRVAAARMINSNANSRGKISELLICNF